MLKKLAVVALALVAVLTVPLGAEAQKRKKTHKLNDVTVTVRQVDTGTGQTVFAGTIANNPLGAGAVVVRIISSSNNNVNAVGKAFFNKGTLNIKFSDTIEPQPDGSVKFTSDDGRITGGTGRYRGATGRFTFNGTAPSPDGTQTHTLNGSVRY